MAATHTHDHDDAHDHSHNHPLAGEGKSGLACCEHGEHVTERHIIIYLVGAALLAALEVSELLGVASQVVQLPAAVIAAVLAVPLLKGAFVEIKRGKPSTSALTSLAVLALFATQEYQYAGWLALMLVVAEQFVQRTAFGAQRAIEQLIGLTPDVARLLGDDGSEREVPLREVTVGQSIRVRAGENLPVDGTIVSGKSSINQASLTGEAVPVEVQSGDLVYAGTTNLTGGLDIAVTQVGSDTTIGKVSQLIREAESTRSPRQLLIEQVAQFFVPIALSVAFVVWFVASQSTDAVVRAEAATRAVTVLVVTCPAALLLASPSAMVASFAAAARLGILIKQTHYLEAASNIDAVVFDKTGTITTGEFQVSRLAPAEGIEGADLLRAAADGEQHSNHPLAQSIIKTARAARIDADGTNDYEELHGRGVRARTADGEVCVGRSSWLLELNPDIRPQVDAVEAKIENMSGVHVMRNGTYLGAVGLEDQVRPKTKDVMGQLRDLGVRSIAIFTGDRLGVAKKVGVAVGVDAVEAECHPEEKHDQIKRLVGNGYRTLMVGDGINDGPSLAAADGGVAMGLSGSDIAANSAGIALMTDDLRRIPFLMQLARKTRLIIAQNIAISIVIVLTGLILATTGMLAVPAAALYHFVGEVFVLANSFRLFRFGEQFTHGEEEVKAPMWEQREASVRNLATAG